MTPGELPPSALAFMTARGLATLTTIRSNGAPHVVPVGYTYDDRAQVVRVICSDGTQKVKNAETGRRAVVCQVDGGHWISLEGPVRVVRDHGAIVDACERYAQRYQTPRENPRRVVIEIGVDRVLGRFPD